MVNRRETQTLKHQDDGGSEIPLDFRTDDDDGWLDHSLDEDLATDDSRAELIHRVPARRLIEMAHEDRHLKWTLADFEHYDEFEYFGDDMVAEYSHQPAGGRRPGRRGPIMDGSVRKTPDKFELRPTAVSMDQNQYAAALPGQGELFHY